MILSPHPLGFAPVKIDYQEEDSKKRDTAPNAKSPESGGGEGSGQFSPQATQYIVCLPTTYKKTSLVILSCHGYVWAGPCGMERTRAAVKKRVSVPNKLSGASDPLEKEG